LWSSAAILIGGWAPLQTRRGNFLAALSEAIASSAPRRSITVWPALVITIALTILKPLAVLAMNAFT
jgi:hypothetical protein